MTVENLTPLMDSIKLRAWALNMLFNSPPREEESSERKGPVITIYSSDGELNLVNTSYVEATELSSGTEVKKLAKEGKLTDAVYDE